MMVKFAMACSSEFFSAWGEPGNQRRSSKGLDGELAVLSEKESGKFTKCFRWKDKALAERAAGLAVRIVMNAKVGYSQNNGASPRTSLIAELRKCHWSPEDIANKCNCDCSSFVMTLCRYNDLDSVTEDMWTGDECKQLRATGAFEEYDVKDGFIWRLGDIAWRSGHTAICCEDEAAPDKVVYNCSAANLRKSPVNGQVIGTVHPGDGMQLLAQNAWYYVKDIKTGKEGWISAIYLK